ncbi:DNA-processing protein DprA [Acidobacteriota bacterium]
MNREDGETRYWIALNFILTDFPNLFTKFRPFLSNIEQIFSPIRTQLLQSGVKEEIVDILYSKSLMDRAKKEIDWLGKKGYTPISLGDERYPTILREIDNPPLVLYCAGESESLKEAAVAIVGARKPTPYGRAVTEKLAFDLASMGVMIVSGMARGIDTIAHWGALKGGRTIAVLGSGLNMIYPPENRGLYKKIIEEGAVVTEYPLDSPPVGFHFPRRNRIISGMSVGLIVTEAAEKSGSLISANLALEQNREVMAIPGNITSSLSHGTNRLIQAGATPVDSWQDVVNTLPHAYQSRFKTQRCEKNNKKPTLSPQEEAIYVMLRTDSLTHVDELIETGGFTVQETLSTLLSLELKDLVDQRPGKFYQRKL